MPPDKLPAMLTALVTGLMIASLGPVNGALQLRTGLWPMLTVVHLLGLSIALIGVLSRPGGLPGADAVRPILSGVLVLMLVLLGVIGRPLLAQGVPAYALLGGALGLLVVLGTVQAISGLGVLTALLLVILAELLGATLIDTLGLLGRPRLPLDLTRVVGILLVLAGALLTLRRAL